MTDVLEREVREALQDGWHLNAKGKPCDTATHDTQWAYRRGCRHPIAKQEKARADRAHRKPRSERGTGDPRVKWITDPLPSCTAAKHTATNTGWRNGCTCPEAEAAHRLYLERDRIKAQQARDAVADPRAPWRGEWMRCDRMNLWLLLHGVPQVDSRTGKNVNTRTERMVAVLRWAGKLRHPNGGLFTAKEIGARLGVTAEEVRALRCEPARRRARRTQRRLAEATWRAQRNARLASRG